MINLSSGIDSLTNFKRNTTTFLDRLRETGQPLVLTINGKAQLVVQDASSYQQLLELVDRLEAVEGIKKGLKDVKRRRTRPIAKVIAEKKRKYAL
jgi:prevent-host-death family protein